MQTLTAVLGGIGIFLLGMTVMTDSLKELAGTALRTILSKAAATPISGTFWGAVVTLLVQSSSAVTMTTIGLVSSGLLTFPQGLGLVFGANVGTTGTGWLVALIGVRVSLSAFALPLIFLGALARLLGSQRIAAAGGAVAGFAMVLYGLTTLQQGMGGLADSLQPSDLPAVLGQAGVGWISGAMGLAALIAIGLAMTAVMQSSTAAIAVTISAFYAGAVNLEQGAALIIGQNIGTATSSALAAIGASITAKRLALAYVLFKLMAAIIALVTFPFAVRLMRGLEPLVSGVTLLAAYHTAFNVVGVAVLLPATQWFTRTVERILPAKQGPFPQALDPSALANPIVAIETARRAIAEVLAQTTGRVISALQGDADRVPGDLAQQEAGLDRVRDFLSELEEPPATGAEQSRMTKLLHALDHASRLIQAVKGGGLDQGAAPAPYRDPQINGLCLRSMADAQTVCTTITTEGGLGAKAAPIGWTISPAVGATLAALADTAGDLAAQARRTRADLLASVSPGNLTAADAFAQVEANRVLESLGHHAWRAAAYLYGADAPDHRSLQKAS